MHHVQWSVAMMHYFGCDFSLWPICAFPTTTKHSHIHASYIHWACNIVGNWKHMHKMFCSKASVSLMLVIYCSIVENKSQKSKISTATFFSIFLLKFLSFGSFLFETIFVCSIVSPWRKAKPIILNSSSQLFILTRGVSHCGLAFYIKKYLKAKEELWKFKDFTMQKCNLQKNCSKRNQNPSRYQNSITNLKFQHKPKYGSFKNPHVKK